MMLLSENQQSPSLQMPKKPLEERRKGKPRGELITLHKNYMKPLQGFYNRDFVSYETNIKALRIQIQALQDANLAIEASSQSHWLQSTCTDYCPSDSLATKKPFLIIGCLWNTLIQLRALQYVFFKEFNSYFSKCTLRKSGYKV